MPEVDLPEKLLKYGRDLGADGSRWLFLTGDRAKIYELARGSFFADAGPRFKRDAEDFLHTENFYLLDRQRRIRGVYSGMKEIDLKQLAEDAQALLDAGD